eukprot:CAMPEP_0184707014 /NCGR_PEP_ID=MMETSP0313-20130426/37054_1 /TAXON_ID=2792 /ORGANISM="Porphyridium aerugineum, Strain SAG 1380-2" /LENGTH=639 /DNA_ID=CAMNT_0027168585 /DNA_START=92 /DNA_END=2011 /DNA_ORIENTATION=-
MTTLEDDEKLYQLRKEPSRIFAEGTVKRHASSRVLKLIRGAQAFCFDVDCTLTVDDGLDSLANFLGCHDEVARITNEAMNGKMDLSEALQRRLDVMNPTVEKLVAYAKSNPAALRLVPGIRELIHELKARNIEVFLISGGFRELILPIADALQVPRTNIFANRFVYMADDEPGEDGFVRIRVRGFDPKEPTSQEGGKPEAIRRIRKLNPYKTVVMVGDGITDLEAVQETGGADLFIGYGGVIEREIVAKNADWFINSYDELRGALTKYRVAVVGSGAWACAATQMIAENCKRHGIFDETVKMWVYEEEFEGGKLTDKMNELHENPVYLPGIKFGDNVLCLPKLQDVVEDADILILCTPHQFIHSLCLQMESFVKPHAFAISLTKGLRVRPDGPQLISRMVRRMLNIDCSVLMGANIATEVKPGSLCEATIGCTDKEQGIVLKKLFKTDYFDVQVITDLEGAELCGTLKNVVALAAGFVDGCNLGHNAKAVIMRVGLREMRLFSKKLYDSVRDDTFFESCGVADLLATCAGGRNYKVAKTYAEMNGKESFDVLEKKLLAGQKLQGVLTSMEIQSAMKLMKCEQEFPLFTAINLIVQGLYPPSAIVKYQLLTLHPPEDITLVALSHKQSVLETDTLKNLKL